MIEILIDETTHEILSVSLNGDILEPTRARLILDQERNKCKLLMEFTFSNSDLKMTILEKEESDW